MACGSAYFSGSEASEDVVRGEGSACGVAADEFPLGEVMYLDDAVYFGFTFDKLVESDILKQVLEIAIEA